MVLDSISFTCVFVGARIALLTQYTGSVAGVCSQARASVLLAPQNHSGLAHFDGQNNFAIFTRMKRTTKPIATAQYINR